MNLNLVAILLSLAMMLTGAGSGGTEPTEAVARSLVLRNVQLSYNGETVALAPQARVGVSTDGEKAVFDFGMDLNGEALLPLQLGVSQEGVTAVSPKGDAAVTVSAKALEGLMEQVNGELNAAIGDAQAQNPEMVKFLTEEFLPAYMGLIQAATDPERQRQINDACNAVVEEKIQRGEGTPTTFEFNDETYDVKAYTYSLEDQQIGELVDAIFGADPVLTNYYNALFKLYSMLPEESGLQGLDSYSAMFERFGLKMRAEIDEQRSDDGKVDFVDAELTIDMSAMAAALPAEAVEEPAGEADGEAAKAAGDTEELTAALAEPIVMNIQSIAVGEFKQVAMDYTLKPEDGKSVEMQISSSEESGSMQFDLTANVLEGEKKVAACSMSAFTAEDGEGGNSYSLSWKAVAKDAFSLKGSVYGLRNADGTSENSVSIEGRTREGGAADGLGVEPLSQGGNFALSFDLDVTADPIEDVANGRGDALVLDDLSQEALTEDGAQAALLAGTMMKMAGALQKDATALAEDASVQKALLLLQGEQLPIEVDDMDAEEESIEFQLGEDGDEAYVVDDIGGEYEIADEEEVEDDGVLGFEEPKFTWLPEGWSVSESDSDTAYDWVELNVTDAQGKNCFYALFFSDPDNVTTSYTVAEDGAIIDGRGITVTDFGEDGLSVTMRQDNICGNMLFASAAIDVETIGKIVAGVQF